jgi:hypothetical protein
MLPRVAALLIVGLFALPIGLRAEQAGSGTPVQAAPTASATAGDGNSSATSQPAPKKSRHSKKKEKKTATVKKSDCVPPPAGSGLIDYCKNPYWEPIQDWNYIQSNIMP